MLDLLNAEFLDVSILARLWGRALLCNIFKMLMSLMVSILARLWGRALLNASGALYLLTVVSILARLWGRALPAEMVLDTEALEFQSSPGFGAGRYDTKFDMHYAFSNVSILARLWGRALL